MTLLLLIGGLLWLGVLVVVLACCVSAARGDAAMSTHRPPLDPRRGRFGHGEAVRLRPRSPLR